MSVQEWWWEADTKIALSKTLKKGAGGFSSAEWDAARRKHSKRVKANTND